TGCLVERRPAAPTEHLAHVRVDGDDRVAGVLEVRGDPMRVALRAVGDTDHGDAPELAKDARRHVLHASPYRARTKTDKVRRHGKSPPRAIESADDARRQLGAKRPLRGGVLLAPPGREPDPSNRAAMAIGRLPIETAALEIRRLGRERRDDRRPFA